MHSISELAARLRSGHVTGAEIEAALNATVQIQHMGLRVDLHDLDRPRVYIDEVTEIHRGGIGSANVNGGVVAMLTDLALGLVGVAYYNEGMTATRDIHLELLRPLHGDRVCAEAWMIEVVGSRVYAACTIKNEAGETCAVATGHLVKGLR